MISLNREEAQIVGSKTVGELTSSLQMFTSLGRDPIYKKNCFEIQKGWGSQNLKFRHSSLKCEIAWESILMRKIACKIHVGHVGCLNLRAESTYTMALFLYHCTHSLEHAI